ncbi:MULTISPECIES: cell division protein FtsL [Niveibacterium]|uniref:Cell division protein FtsL n=1 Tax=Niveibacterium microcysteis TaxID=2811415 RepID=A0ABX7M2V8_9RHOO|nr:MULTISPECIES: cell division protein FtsL [Niveibacterium]QSI76107.1 cell division protein FtsL [Niveibacterium microcysteis]
MVRLNVILIVLVLASALALVSAQHQSRKLFIELERLQTRERALEVEWGQLQLEQSTWAAHSRVEKVARERLHLVTPDPRHVLVLDGDAGAAR